MTTWRYAAARTIDTASGEEHWGVREVYTDEDGSLSYTDSDVRPAGESAAELRRDLQRMTADLAEPYLDLTGGTAALVQWPPAAPSS